MLRLVMGRRRGIHSKRPNAYSHSKNALKSGGLHRNRRNENGNKSSLLKTIAYFGVICFCLLYQRMIREKQHFKLNGDINDKIMRAENRNGKSALTVGNELVRNFEKIHVGGAGKALSEKRQRMKGVGVKVQRQMKLQKGQIVKWQNTVTDDLLGLELRKFHVVGGVGKGVEVFYCTGSGCINGGDTDDEIMTYVIIKVRLRTYPTENIVNIPPLFFSEKFETITPESPLSIIDASSPTLFGKRRALNPFSNRGRSTRTYRIARVQAEETDDQDSRVVLFTVIYNNSTVVTDKSDNYLEQLFRFTTDSDYCEFACTPQNEFFVETRIRTDEATTTKEAGQIAKDFVKNLKKLKL